MVKPLLAKWLKLLEEQKTLSLTVQVSFCFGMLFLSNEGETRALSVQWKGKAWRLLEQTTQ